MTAYNSSTHSPSCPSLQSSPVQREPGRKFASHRPDQTQRVGSRQRMVSARHTLVSPWPCVGCGHSICRLLQFVRHFPGEKSTSSSPTHSVLPTYPSNHLSSGAQPLILNTNINADHLCCQLQCVCAAYRWACYPSAQLVVAAVLGSHQSLQYVELCSS